MTQNRLASFPDSPGFPCQRNIAPFEQIATFGAATRRQPRPAVSRHAIKDACQMNLASLALSMVHLRVNLDEVQRTVKLFLEQFSPPPESG